MRAILDSHVLLWWLADSGRLSDRARTIVARGDNELFWSAASTWELAIKIGLGKLRLDGTLSEFLGSALREQSIRVLPIQHSHALRVESLPPHHRDPFDRMLVAQAQVERLAIVSADPRLAAYEVDRIW